jgi:hypothetical protein
MFWALATAVVCVVLYRRLTKLAQVAPSFKMEAYPAERLLGVKRCLVSVGTTEFDALIQALDQHCEELVDLLQKNGFSCLTLQIGRGQFVPDRLLALSSSALRIETMRFILGLPTLIEHTSLVISHAGGSADISALRAASHAALLCAVQVRDPSWRPCAPSGSCSSWSTKRSWTTTKSSSVRVALLALQLHACWA